MTLLEELKEEEELVGVFLSKHPLDDFKFVYDSIVTHSVKEYRENLENKAPIVFQMMGIITSAKEFMSQKGNPYARFNFMDYSGTVEISIFTDKYLKFKNLIDKDYILLIQGQTDYSKAKDEMRLNINAMQLVSEIDAMALYKSVHVEMTPSDLEQGKHQIVSDVLSQFPGKCPLYFNFYDADDNMTVRMVSKAGLNFVSEVREMLDEMEVKFAPKLDERWVPERKDESRRFYNS